MVKLSSYTSFILIFSLLALNIQQIRN